MKYTRLVFFLFLLPFLFASTARAQCTGSACTEVVNNGPDSNKKIIAALVAGKTVYTLEGHETELDKYAAQKVTVKGSLKGETLTVESVLPAK